MSRATDSEDGIIRRLNLIKQADAGLFERIECPCCNQPAISAWFTHPSELEYRTWFRCSNCTFEMRAHNTGRPISYREDRIDKELEQRDRLVLEKLVFKRPADA